MHVPTNTHERTHAISCCTVVPISDEDDDISEDLDAALRSLQNLTAKVRGGAFLTATSSSQQWCWREPWSLSHLGSWPERPAWRSNMHGQLVWATCIGGCLGALDHPGSWKGCLGLDTLQTWVPTWPASAPPPQQQHCRLQG